MLLLRALIPGPKVLFFDGSFCFRSNVFSMDLKALVSLWGWAGLYTAVVLDSLVSEPLWDGGPV